MKTRLYHTINNGTYCAPDEMSLTQYKSLVRQAYGSLRGVKFWKGESRSALVPCDRFCPEEENSKMNKLCDTKTVYQSKQ